MIHPQPKPEPRKRAKGRKVRQEAQIKKLTRLACVLRDGPCRMTAFIFGDVVAIPDYRNCEGPPEWAHFGGKRRARTRGQAPEIRHTTAGSLMLCREMHRAYDEGRLLITALTRHGCDGRLKFRWRKS